MTRCTVDFADGNAFRRLFCTCRACENLKLRRVLEMFLNRALVSGANDGRFILLREFRRQLDVQQYLADQACSWVRLQALHNTDTVGRNAALLAKAQDVNAGAGAEPLP
jgi:hypothetical protein